MVVPRQDCPALPSEEPPGSRVRQQQEHSVARRKPGICFSDARRRAIRSSPTSLFERSAESRPTDSALPISVGLLRHTTATVWTTGTTGERSRKKHFERHLLSSQKTEWMTTTPVPGTRPRRRRPRRAAAARQWKNRQPNGRQVREKRGSGPAAFHGANRPDPETCDPDPAAERDARIAARCPFRCPVRPGCIRSQRMKEAPRKPSGRRARDRCRRIWAR